MTLHRLDAREINRALNDNFDLWSPGLDRSRYRHYQWWQLKHPWGRRNLEYYGWFSDDGLLTASCKRYNFEFESRGRSFKIAGVGAVFVPAQHRGKAYGVRMLEGLADLSLQEGFDAMLLNSDIDPAYYSKLGYHLFDCSAFSVELSGEWLNDSIAQLERLSDRRLDETFCIRSIELDDIAEMCRHHKRWLAGRKYGMNRPDDYWNYKVGRELYLFEHSRLNWPKLDIITDNYSEFLGGYALIEQSGPYLRVLEVIGPERIFNSLWSQILRLARRRRVTRIRGWRLQAPPVKGLYFHDRDWSFPMICPLKEELADVLTSWTLLEPAGMLELDHF